MRAIQNQSLNLYRLLKIKVKEKESVIEDLWRKRNAWLLNVGAIHESPLLRFMNRPYLLKDDLGVSPACPQPAAWVGLCVTIFLPKEAKRIFTAIPNAELVLSKTTH